MDLKIRLLFLCILISIHLPSFNADYGTGKSEEGLSEKVKVAGEFLKEDARVVLAKTGIGSSFRRKRDKPQSESKDHSAKSETLELAAAGKSVEAADDVVSAAIETEEAIQTAQENHDHSQHFHASKEHERSNSVSESDENCDDDCDSDEGASETESVESAGSVDEHEGIGTGLTHDDRDHQHGESQLQKIMSDSSELAEEIRMIHATVSKREAQLLEEMESLKLTLTAALTVLKKSQLDSDGFAKRQKRIRREFYPDNETPYKACVYIESSPEGDENMHKNKPVYPPEPDVKEFMPKGGQAHSAASNTHEFNEKSQESTGENDDVDLSKVYWLKLPESSNEEEMERKVESVISEVNGEGKDALIIPVSKGLHNSQEVSQGFLKAVQVKPEALKSKYARKLRSPKVRRA